MLKGIFSLHEHWGNITSSYYSGGWSTTPERQDASKKLLELLSYLLCPSMSWEWGMWIFNIFRLIYFNWRIITLQYCGGFCHTLTWISHRYTCVPNLETPSQLLPHPILLGCSSAPALSALFHASNLDWSFISQMVIYMFQCYSLKSSHPRLLP